MIKILQLYFCYRFNFPSTSTYLSSYSLAFFHIPARNQLPVLVVVVVARSSTSVNFTWSRMERVLIQSYVRSSFELKFTIYRLLYLI